MQIQHISKHIDIYTEMNWQAITKILTTVKCHIFAYCMVSTIKKINKLIYLKGKKFALMVLVL